MATAIELDNCSIEPVVDYDGNGQRYGLGITSLTGANVAIFVGAVVLIG